MKENVMISVIIPLYEKEGTILRAVRSVLGQTFDDPFEVIIVNDGSKDGSLSVVNSIVDSRITVIEQPNFGVSAARNRGILEARGELVAFLDADDEWDSDFLKTIVTLIDEYPFAKVFATNYRYCDCYGNYYATVIKNVDFNGRNSGVIDNYFEIAAISSPPVSSTSVAVRRRDILAIGGFPEGVKSGEDLLTWAKLLLEGELAYCLAPHATYHLSEGHEYGSLPVRRQDPGDPVGMALKKFLRDYAGTKGLGAYISHWHKMRASVAIRFGERGETVRECLLSLKYNFRNFKVIPFICLAMMPHSLRKRIIRLKKHAGTHIPFYQRS